jgi:hypothetical protein
MLYGIDKVNSILKYIIELGLFEMQNNRVFCFKMANRLDNTVSRSPEINKIKQLRSDYVDTTKKLGAEDNTIHDNTTDKNTTDKNTTDKNNKKEKTTFQKPTLQELLDYKTELNDTTIDTEAFFDYYESKGWLIGKAPMKSWKAAVRLWIRNNKKWNKEKAEAANPTKPVKPVKTIESVLAYAGVYKQDIPEVAALARERGYDVWETEQQAAAINSRVIQMRIDKEKGKQK